MKSLQALLVVSMMASFSTQAAAVPVLTPNQIRAVIGTYPAEGSQAEAKDDQILLDWQRKRTPEQCAAAGLQSDSSLRKFFGKALSSREITYLNIRLLKVPAVSGANVLIAKRTFDRQRPYERNSEIKPCIKLGGESSYPSGHATSAYLYGRVLSKIYPKRAKLFMQLADQAALNRVLGGVHHPSDVEAGKKLADHLAKKFF
jgi:acid phosphatase (class A)